MEHWLEDSNRTTKELKKYQEMRVGGEDGD